MKVLFIPETRTAITGYTGYVGRSIVKFGSLQGIESFLSDQVASHVIHLAAHIEEDSNAVVENQKIDQEVYDYCELHKAHLTYASGNNVYPFTLDCDINSPLDLDTSSNYAKSKIQGETLLKSYTFPRAILRIADVFGLNQRHGALFQAIQEAVVLHHPLKLFGSGSKTRNYIYIEDLVQYILHCSSISAEGIFNVCYSDPQSTVAIMSSVVSFTQLQIDHIPKEVVENIRTMIATPLEGFNYKYNFNKSLELFCLLSKEKGTQE